MDGIAQSGRAWCAASEAKAASGGASRSPHPEVRGAKRRASKDTITAPPERPSRPAARAPQD